MHCSFYVHAVCRYKCSWPQRYKMSEAFCEILSDHLATVRNVKQVHDGLVYSSIYAVHALVTRIATQLLNVEAPILPPSHDDTVCMQRYTLLCQQSLLFYHSMLGPLHVAKKTMQDMEDMLFYACKAYVLDALDDGPPSLRRNE